MAPLLELPMMPPTQRVDLGDIDMAYWEAGPKSVRPPIILCHGFPELAFSWRHQIRDLSDAGWRVIAPDQRGYGQTTAPKSVDAYTMEHLCNDLVTLLDRLGIERAIFAGHDWGGFVVWQMALRHPDRVAGVIGLNTPHLRRYPMEPISLFSQVFGERFYIVRFQEAQVPEQILEADPVKTMKYFMRLPAAADAAFDGRPEAERSFDLLDRLPDYDPAKDTHQFLTPTELDVYASAFAASGFFGPVSWYRNFEANWRASEGTGEIVTQPSLMIMAQKDLVLPPRLADEMEAIVPNLDKVLIEDCGHWTQQEKPAETSRAMLDWLKRHF